MSTTTLSTSSTISISTPKRYHPALVALHWGVAVLIFATVLFAEGEGGFGAAGSGIPTIGIHMILGVSTLVLLTLRLFVRMFTKHPEWASTGTPFLDLVGRLTHLGLYIFTYGITITGIILANQRGWIARIFGFGATTPTFNRGAFSLGELHGLSWALLVLLVMLHVGAALYHQFIKKDNLLSRMWFGN